MSEEDLLNLQCLVGNYLNGFKIVSIQKDSFINGQINLFTDVVEDTNFGDKRVIKFYVRNKDEAIIYKEQVDIDKYILTEFEKWLEDKLKDSYANNDVARGYKNALKICFYKLQELKGDKK